jgi:hypothetical protein
MAATTVIDIDLEEIKSCTPWHIIRMVKEDYPSGQVTLAWTPDEQLPYIWCSP